MQILRFKFCNDLTVSNLTITNSPKAHIRINSCENATFSDISIRSPGDSPNTDGFDIYTSKNILIQNSTIQCGKPCLHFMYSNHISMLHGFKIIAICSIVKVMIA